MKKLAFQLCSVLLLAAILLTAVPPPPAQAFFAGLSFEINPAVIVNLILQHGKEYIGDSIAWFIVGNILATVGPSLVKWVATGDFGDPFFVRNWRGFLLNAADVAVSEFDRALISGFDDAQEAALESCLDNAQTAQAQQACFNQFSNNPQSVLCAPFRNFLQVQLGSPRIGGLNPYGQQYRQRLTCLNNFLNNIQNFDNFVNNFDNGGWLVFNQLNNPNNSPFSLYFTGLAATEQHIQRLTQARLNESQSGQGFLSKTNKLTDKIQSPGKRIADRLQEAEDAPWDRLEAADEIKELIGTLINAAIIRAKSALAN